MTAFKNRPLDTVQNEIGINKQFVGKHTDVKEIWPSLPSTYYAIDTFFNVSLNGEMQMFTGKFCMNRISINNVMINLGLEDRI